MAAQGFPTSLFKSAQHTPTDPQLQDIAGNAFPSTCMLAVLLSVFAHLPEMLKKKKAAQQEDPLDVSDLAELCTLGL